MATPYSSGGQSPTSLSRTVERVFEDAQHTGEITLSGRKLREYPKIAPKYDLADTIHTGKQFPRRKIMKMKSYVR